MARQMRRLSTPENEGIYVCLKLGTNKHSRSTVGGICCARVRHIAYVFPVGGSGKVGMLPYSVRGVNSSRAQL